MKQYQRGGWSLSHGLLFFMLLYDMCPRQWAQSPDPYEYYSFRTGPTTCYTCASGNYSGKAGSGSCEACAPGTYSPSNGSSGCLPCLAGTYNADFGASSCLSCPTSTQNMSTVCPPPETRREYFQPPSPKSMHCQHSQRLQLDGRIVVDSTQKLSPIIEGGSRQHLRKDQVRTSPP